MPRALRLAVAGLASMLALAHPAQAAPAWIYRSITLPRGDVALDLGLGIGRAPLDANRSATGVGMNLELAFGVAHDVEMGIRTGFRFDADGQFTQADKYGRPFDTETYGTNADTVANPELRVRWAVARGGAGQLGLEIRAYLPIEQNSRFGLMFGLPLALRAGALRFDTGIYVPVIFTDPSTTVIFSIPLHIWIQMSASTWLGPLLGFRVISAGGASEEQFPLGFGLGTMPAHNIDLRTWFLFPHINGDAAARTFGFGLALQVRFE